MYRLLDVSVLPRQVTVEQSFVLTFRRQRPEHVIGQKVDPGNADLSSIARHYCGYLVSNCPLAYDTLQLKHFS
jgi:hypothetical protein